MELRQCKDKLYNLITKSHRYNLKWEIFNDCIRISKGVGNYAFMCVIRFVSLKEAELEVSVFGFGSSYMSVKNTDLESVCEDVANKLNKIFTAIQRATKAHQAVGDILLGK